MMPAARLSFPHPRTSFLSLSPDDSSSWKGWKGEERGSKVSCFGVVASKHTLLVLILAYGRLGFDSGRPGAGSSALLCVLREDYLFGNCVYLSTCKSNVIC